jgi:transcriptional regulator with XRE-family HTH domain
MSVWQNGAVEDRQRTAGDVIRVLRAAQNWTLEDLASRSGVHRQSLWKIENGEADPKASTLRKIAEAFGVTRLPEPHELPSFNLGGASENQVDSSASNQTHTESRRSAASAASTPPAVVTSPVRPPAQDVLSEEERQMLTPLEQSVIRRLRSASVTDRERIDQLIDVVTGQAEERAKGSTGTFDPKPTRFRS